MSNGDIDPTIATIESALREGEAHLRQLERASSILTDLFPLNAEALKAFPEDTVPVLDQFIYRFTKLQDSMATRLLPSLYAYLNADDTPRPFLDILSFLEKIGILTSERDWQFFRGLRNNLAHDYPESTVQTAETLNTLFARWRDLLTMFETARAGYRSKSKEAYPESGD